MRTDALRIRTRKFSSREYDWLTKTGFFRPDERLELLDGQLVVKEPQHSPHVTAVLLVTEALRGVFGAGWLIRPQFPVALATWSEPEPDVCVVPGSPRDYRDAHPTRPVLVVEVSHTRLRFDRTKKASVYARAGVTDYWIVNIPDRVLEVHREPGRLDAPRRRWGYRSIQTFGPAEVVSPIALPSARVVVADLLP
jgi:Uma2 family endonuclease